MSVSHQAQKELGREKKGGKLVRIKVYYGHRRGYCIRSHTRDGYMVNMFRGEESLIIISTVGHRIVPGYIYHPSYYKKEREGRGEGSVTNVRGVAGQIRHIEGH